MTSKPDLYKAEVPLFGVGAAPDIIKTARRFTDGVDCPWVVLAGRAVWADATAAAAPGDFMRTPSAARLQQLTKGLSGNNSNVQ